MSIIAKLGGAAALTVAAGAAASSQARFMAGRQVANQSIRLASGTADVANGVMVRAAEASQKPLVTVGDVYAAFREKITNMRAILGNLRPSTTPSPSSSPSLEGSPKLSFRERAVKIDSDPLSKVVNVIKNIDFIYGKIAGGATFAYGYAIAHKKASDSEARIEELTATNTQLSEKHIILAEKHMALAESHMALKENHKGLAVKHEELSQKHEGLSDTHSTLEQRCAALEVRNAALEDKLKASSAWKLF